MQYTFKTSIRVVAGVIVFLLGLIGLMLPFLQGWLLIFAGLALISPKHGKQLSAKLKEYWEKARARFFPRRRNHQ